MKNRVHLILEFLVHVVLALSSVINMSYALFLVLIQANMGGPLIKRQIHEEDSSVDRHVVHLVRDE